MSKLDSEDLKAIKGLIEVTIEDVIEREEQTLLSHRVSNHEDRIEKIESHLGMPAD